jgi:hypothetical protein
LSPRSSAVLVWRSLYVLEPANQPWTLRSSTEGRPLSIARKVHPLSGFAPLQSVRGVAWRDLPSPFGRVSTSLPPTRHHHKDVDVSRSEPAIRSPDGTSLEVPRPFSAISHASPLSRYWSRQVVTSNGRGIASPAAFPSSGFLSLLTACSSHVLVGLFHPTGTRGVPHPPELFPLPQLYCLSAALALLSFAGIRRKHRLPPAFRALLHARVR